MLIGKHVFFFCMVRLPPRSTRTYALCPYTTRFRAYGGFAVALVPAWAGTWLAAWVQGGGVLVLAHLRGGGELGPEMWHQGRLKLKQNSFNDVYAISEDLIARGIDRKSTRLNSSH